MTETLVLPKKLSEADYLSGEEDGLVKHEYVDGVLYAMSGASIPHNELAGELYYILRNHLPARCRPYAMDAKVRIKTDKTTVFYYPDVMVACEPIKKSTHYIANPVLLIEVLSPKTERIDRSEKFLAYAQIPSLQEYVLISQKRPMLEIFRRTTDWQREAYGRTDVVTLQSIEFELSIEALFERIGM